MLSIKSLAAAAFILTKRFKALLWAEKLLLALFG